MSLSDRSEIHCVSFNYPVLLYMTDIHIQKYYIIGIASWKSCGTICMRETWGERRGGGKVKQSQS
jgi:hypothetical protein